MPYLPSINSAAVMMAPTITSRHLIFASGENLNMSENNKASMPRDTIEFTICITMRIDSEKWLVTHEPIAASMDETTRDTMSINAMDIIRPNEKKRALSILIIPDFDISAFTSQIEFNDF